MNKAQKKATEKALAEAIYRVNPFDVMGKEGRAIANVTAMFRESTAPDFMLTNLLDDLYDTARRKARSRTKDRQLWQNISDFLKTASQTR